MNPPPAPSPLLRAPGARVQRPLVDARERRAARIEDLAVPLPWWTSQSRTNTRLSAQLGHAQRGRDGDVVEQAEAHRLSASAWWPGGTHRAEARLRLARHSAPASAHGPPRPCAAALEDGRPGEGVGVDPPAARASHSSRIARTCAAEWTSSSSLLGRRRGEARRSQPSQSCSASARRARPAAPASPGAPAEHVAGRGPGTRGRCSSRPLMCLRGRHHRETGTCFTGAGYGRRRKGHDARDGLRGGRPAPARARAAGSRAGPGPGAAEGAGLRRVPHRPARGGRRGRRRPHPPLVLGHQIVGDGRRRRRPGAERLRRPASASASRGSAGPAATARYCRSGRENLCPRARSPATTSTAATPSTPSPTRATASRCPTGYPRREPRRCCARG